MWILQTHHSTMLKISNHTTHSTARPCYPKPKDFKRPLNLIHAIILEQLHVHKTSHTFIVWFTDTEYPVINVSRSQRFTYCTCIMYKVIY